MFQGWYHHSTLAAPREKAAAVTLPGVGVMIMGGFKQISTELLVPGADSWQAGPDLPGDNETDYYGICAVTLSDSEVMVVGGSDGWTSGAHINVWSAGSGVWEAWDDLLVDRWGHACTRLDNLVITAGGVSPAFTIEATATALDVNTRRQWSLGSLHGARAWFGMAVLDGRILAFGGMSPLLRDQYSDIQQLDLETEQWTAWNQTMQETRGISSFGSVNVEQSYFC